MHFKGLSLKRYRAFERQVDVDFAPITIVLGRNHSGKTTLCRAPWFVSQPFSRNAAAPFPYADPSQTSPPALLRVAQGLSGFEAEFRVSVHGVHWSALVHATAQATGEQQPLLAEIMLSRNGKTVFDAQDLGWEDAQRAIRDAGFPFVGDEIDGLSGVRRDALPSYPLQGFMPTRVGFRGEDAPNVLGAARSLDALNQWAENYLDVSYEVERDRTWDSFRVIVNDGTSRVLLSESGTGLVQVLPVAAAVLLLPRLPALYCIEHPELHLHPHAHRAVAELLIEGRKRHPDTCFLIETHSDTLVLRLRRAVVEKRLNHRDVRLIFVDRDEGGSTVSPISLSDRGVPDWWPTGVFSEAHEEFTAMRRVLNERDAP